MFRYLNMPPKNQRELMFLRDALNNYKNRYHLHTTNMNQLLIHMYQHNRDEYDHIQDSLAMTQRHVVVYGDRVVLEELQDDRRQQRTTSLVRATQNMALEHDDPNFLQRFQNFIQNHTTRGTVPLVLALTAGTIARQYSDELPSHINFLIQMVTFMSTAAVGINTARAFLATIDAPPMTQLPSALMTQARQDIHNGRLLIRETLDTIDEFRRIPNPRVELENGGDDSDGDAAAEASPEPVRPRPPAPFGVGSKSPAPPPAPPTPAPRSPTRYYPPYRPPTQARHVGGALMTEEDFHPN